MKQYTFEAIHLNTNRLCDEVYAEVSEDADLKKDAWTFLKEVRIDHPAIPVRIVIRAMDGDVVAKFTEDEIIPDLEVETTIDTTNTHDHLIEYRSVSGYPITETTIKNTCDMANRIAHNTAEYVKGAVYVVCTCPNRIQSGPVRPFPFTTRLAND